MNLRRSLARSALALVVSAAAALPGSISATAGGPTSVLIVNPSTSATGALYASDKDYMVLQDALGTSNTADGQTPPPGLVDGPGSPSTLNITWMIHDVSVWRVDRVNIHYDGTVWVRTYESPGASVWDENMQPTWHAAADPELLLAVLERAGVLTAKEVDGVDLAAAPVQPDDIASGSRPGQMNWWWLLPGTAAGIVLGVVGRPYAASLIRRRTGGPRQQLIDT